MIAQSCLSRVSASTCRTIFLLVTCLFVANCAPLRYACPDGRVIMRRDCSEAEQLQRRVWDLKIWLKGLPGMGEGHWERSPIGKITENVWLMTMWLHKLCNDYNACMVDLPSYNKRSQELLAMVGRFVNVVQQEKKKSDVGSSTAGDALTAIESELGDPPPPRPPPPPPSLEGWIRIEPGCFNMGTPAEEDGHHPRESPVHEACITRPFHMKETEVTQGEWRALMGSNRSFFRYCGDNCPVERVGWWDALDYCNRLSQLNGLEQCYSLDTCKGRPGERGFRCENVSFVGPACEGYRLPTEAEWEYAARAGTAGSTYDGEPTRRGCSSDPILSPLGWYCGNSAVAYRGCQNIHKKSYGWGPKCAGTKPVKKRRPNAWGLYDMLGNVSEWVWDFKSADYEGLPTDDSTGAATGRNRIIRGGAYHLQVSHARTGARRSAGPVCNAEDAGYSAVGFRPVRTILKRE